MVTCKCVVVATALLLWAGCLQDAAADGRTSNITNGPHATHVVYEAATLKQEMNLSDYIWEGAVDLLPQAWNATFIAGVANGLLNPNFYTDYMLQDAVYCRVVAQLWEQLANNASVDVAIRIYANESISGFFECSTWLFDRWHVKDDRENNYGIIMAEPVQEYTSFIEQAMVAHAPNMLIATYACLKLWNNLTSALLPIVGDPSTNPYAIWVYENHGGGSSMRKQAAQMDEWDKSYQWYDWTEALDLFRLAMKNEINFFGHAGNSSYSSLLEVTKPSNSILSRNPFHNNV